MIANVASIIGGYRVNVAWEKLCKETRNRWYHILPGLTEIPPKCSILVMHIQMHDLHTYKYIKFYT